MKLIWAILAFAFLSCDFTNSSSKEIEKENFPSFGQATSRNSESNSDIIIQFYSKNFTEDSLFYLIDDFDKIIDSVNVKKKLNEVTVRSKIPQRLFLTPEKEVRKNNFNSFYFDNKINKIFFDGKKGIDSIKISGSQINDEYEELYKSKFVINKALNYNLELINIYSSLIKNSSSLTANDSIQNIIVELELEKEELFKKSLSLELEYFKDKPNSFLAANNLGFWIMKPFATNYINDIKIIHQNFTPEIKETEKAKILENKIKSFYTSNIGNPVPEIIVKDISNNLFSFQNLKGKYFLIDFWASWCVPCIKDFPFLKDLEKANHEKLEIVSISLDTDINAWKTAIKKNYIDRFTHIALEENPENKIKLDFFVQAIPVKILVNPEGIIIGRWRGYDKKHQDEINSLIR
ncbi:MAG: TlpA disulfide reductase family protein [Gillisia sp.]